ncbi:tol-pal system protein YbgF [Solimicrobium silvestre]|uniref:Cell division coordinator CpoB n=1 Tax=Solimicrobium silvestre TaxID=2099400 RepID=A0A2S9H5Q3_9BURK|nr:tol-pal system protein YbgF [Solimicrobium silvestre]PRC95271.1 Tol-pal system protein YbgF [Solimicrobium silvestre]
MKRFFLSLLTVLSIGILTTPAHAGLFDDDEARKAILDLRTKLDTVSSKLDDQITNKADKTVVLDQLNQLDSLRQEIAKLRGQVEVLSNDVSDSQRRQKDFYVDLDNRLRKLEPQKLLVDGKEAQIDPNEQKSYDTALAVFQSGDYSGAANALNSFIQMYTRSAYVPNAQYSLGIAYYAQKDYRNAIATFQSLVKASPDFSRAPDAMLTIATCYSEQKDKTAARKVLQNLRTQYPDSAAAKTAIDRLNALK